MNYPAASSEVSTRHSGKPEGLIRNLDSRFRGNDSNAASGGVLNPGYAINNRVNFDNMSVFSVRHYIFRYTG
jgi:hypothetical protein